MFSIWTRRYFQDIWTHYDEWSHYQKIRYRVMENNGQSWYETDLNSAEMYIIAVFSVSVIFIAYTFYTSTVIVAAIVYVL